MATTEGLKCPHCGNTDDKYISDNGVKGRSMICLCTKPCAPGESSFEHLPDDHEDAQVCGMQWEPDGEEEVWECHDCGEEYCISQFDVMQDNVECRHCGSRNVMGENDL